jgi:bacillopeptidase F (M6 metalloprotease family)
MCLGMDRCTPRFGADLIEYNNYYFDMARYTYAVIRGVQTHEIGHALGIGDHYSATYSGTTMYGYTFSISGTTYTSVRPDGLVAHDKADYNAIY